MSYVNSLFVQNLSWISWNLQNAGTCIRCSAISRNLLLMLSHYSFIKRAPLDLYKLHMPAFISWQRACLKTQILFRCFFSHVAGLFLHHCMMLSSTARTNKNEMNSCSYFNLFWTLNTSSWQSQRGFVSHVTEGGCVVAVSVDLFILIGEGIS